MLTSHRHTNRAGFQNYTAAPAITTTVLPSNVSYNDGVVVPVAFNAAMYGLHDTNGFGLQAPSLQPQQSDKTVVIYGGSSSVGAMAIQLAVASGAKVIATASSHNFDFVKKAGAAEVFDYKSSSVIDDVASAVKSAGGDFVGVFDTISTPDTFKISVPMLEYLGGGVLITVLPGAPELPSNIKLNNIHGYGPVIFPFWDSYITKALEGGHLKCLPPPSVVGKGVESFQKALDESRKGVSARKLIVEI